MKSVAFFLDNSAISSIDCSNIVLGNPGIGGTENLIILVSTLLSIRNKIKVKLFVQTEGTFPSVLDVVKIDNFVDAYKQAKNNKYDYLIFRNSPEYINTIAFTDTNSNTKLIPWCHNFGSYKDLDRYSKSKNVARIVCVGKEQMDRYRDLQAFYKSEYIYNCIFIPDQDTDNIKLIPANNRPNIVTYMGSLVSEKGFHVLAHAWPEIVKCVKDAQLYVVGSGKLYSRDAKLGDFGIAEESYEKSFVGSLLDKDGTLMKNVHFLGILGDEKRELLMKTKVGVPNPTGKTETFGLSAVEMQIFGANVVTKECPGFMDTVKLGCLYKYESELASCVVEKLMNPDCNYNNARRFIIENFSYTAVIKEWETLLLDAIPNNRRLHCLKLENPFYHIKWIKEGVRRLKKIVPLFNCILPPIERIYNYFHSLIRKCKM